MIANIKHWAILSFAIVCIIAGLATVWLPIPTGVPLLALGSFLVIANSRIGRNFFRKLRTRLGWLDHAVLWLEERAGRSFARVLKTTRPLRTRHRKKAESRSDEKPDADADPASASSTPRASMAISTSSPSAHSNPSRPDDAA